VTTPETLFRLWWAGNLAFLLWLEEANAILEAAIADDLLLIGIKDQ